MWPFSKRYSLASCGILRDFTDWHCHLLPGVDDGVQSMEEALRLLSSYEQQGIREVWLTPHIMEDYPNTTDGLRARFAELQSAYQGPVALHLASENMLDHLFEENLKRGDLLPLGPEGRHLLVETSYYNPPYDFHNIFVRIRNEGYAPVLAHPERYIYMEREDYERLKQLNVAFQLNLASLIGVYGPDARRKAKWMLKNRFYQYYGTDTHRLTTWDAITRKKQIPEDVVQML